VQFARWVLVQLVGNSQYTNCRILGFTLELQRVLELEAPVGQDNSMLAASVSKVLLYQYQYMWTIKKKWNFWHIKCVELPKIHKNGLKMVLPLWRNYWNFKKCNIQNPLTHFPKTLTFGGCKLWWYLKFHFYLMRSHISKVLLDQGDLCWKASKPCSKYVPSNGDSGIMWSQQCGLLWDFVLLGAICFVRIHKWWSIW